MSKYFLALCLLLTVLSGPIENCAENQAHRIILGSEPKLYYFNKIYTEHKIIRITWTQECVKKGIRVSYLEARDLFFGGQFLYVTTDSEGGGIKIPYTCVEQMEPAELKET